jgi:hypothetical protein
MKFLYLSLLVLSTACANEPTLDIAHPIPRHGSEGYDSPHLAIDLARLRHNEVRAEVASGMEARHTWHKISNASETASVIFTGVGAVIAFAASFYKLPIIAFVAGIGSTVALVLKGFSSYAITESQERTAQVNAELARLGIAPLPAIENPSLQN